MFGERYFNTPSIPTFQVPATIADKLLRVVSSYNYYCALLQIHGKTPKRLPSARTIKARNGNYYKSNAESIRSSEPLVSNIVLIQSPKSEPLVSNIRLIQSAKGEPLVSYIGLIQSAKGEPLVSNIGLIQSPKGESLVSNNYYYSTNSESKKRAPRNQYNNHPGRNKAAA